MEGRTGRPFRLLMLPTYGDVMLKDKNSLTTLPLGRALYYTETFMNHVLKTFHDVWAQNIPKPCKTRCTASNIHIHILSASLHVPVGTIQL